jgi:hypothetical protein
MRYRVMELEQEVVRGTHDTRTHHLPVSVSSIVRRHARLCHVWHRVGTVRHLTPWGAYGTVEEVSAQLAWLAGMAPYSPVGRHGDSQRSGGCGASGRSG